MAIHHAAFFIPEKTSELGHQASQAGKGSRPAVALTSAPPVPAEKRVQHRPPYPSSISLLSHQRQDRGQTPSYELRGGLGVGLDSGKLSFSRACDGRAAPTAKKD